MTQTTTLPLDHAIPNRYSLRTRHLSMIAMGGVIGAGLFVGSSAAIAGAGPASIISYALAGAIMFMTMRMLSQLIVALPRVRAFTEFARLGLGNWAGFTTGWLYWYFWVIVIPIEAIAGATLLQSWLPLPTWQLGTVLMLAMTAVNLLSPRSYGEFEFWFASIKVAAIVAFIVIAALYACGITSPHGPTFTNLVADGGFAPHGPLAVVATVTTVIFSMVGAEIVAVAAAESETPAGAVARMGSSLVIRIMIFFIGSVAMIVTVMPWSAVKPGASPFTAALQVMHIPAAPLIMSAIILTAVLSCLNSAFYVTSRVLLTLAEKGDAPRWLVQTNARHVPTRSVLLSSVFGFAGVCAATLSPGVVFAFLINASGALILFVYIAMAVAHARLLTTTGQLQTAVSPQTQFGPLNSLTIAVMILVLVAMACTPADASQLWISLLTLAIVLGLYFALRRGRSVVLA